MSRLRDWQTILSIAAGSLAIIALSFVRARCADDNSSPLDPRPSSPPTAAPHFEYYGSTNCQRCHYNPIQQDFDDGRVYFLGMNESQIWSQHDRHSQAYKLLQCERGQAIARRLGWDVLHDRRCLSCHADWQANRQPAPDDDVLSEGVACEACHGPSSGYINEHSLNKWRAVPLPERAEKFGMTLVRDPTERAKVCLACHIGNVQQGKIITHEMYAAGHPPLPSFELRYFGQSMKHWSDIRDQLARLNREMPSHADNTRHDLEFLQQQLGESKDTIPALKTVLVGAVLTLRQSVQLLADEASGKIARSDQVSADNQNSTWPEFALYDCAMCHHDLRYPAWRQNHATGGSPGRPQIPRWPQALVGVAIEQAAGADQAAAGKMKHEFTALLAELDAPFLKQPFGDRAAIAEPATKLVAFLDGL
jgi:hypothetical protein